MDITPEKLRFIIFTGGLAFWFVVENFFKERSWKEKHLKRLAIHLGMAVFNTTFLKYLCVPAFLWWANIIHERGWGLAPLLGLKGLPEIIFSLIFLDFIDYWWHRVNHQIPFLWRFHKVHHSDTHIDVTSSLRFHPGEFFFSTVAKASWIFLCGPSIWAFAIFEAAITMASQFHHSNINFPKKFEKILRLVIVTPIYHCAHHTVTKRTGDANYSTIFIWWDRLFGTYQEPDSEELKSLGIANNIKNNLNLKEIFLFPFK